MHSFTKPISHEEDGAGDVTVHQNLLPLRGMRELLYLSPQQQPPVSVALRHRSYRSDALGGAGHLDSELFRSPFVSISIDDRIC